MSGSNTSNLEQGRLSVYIALLLFVYGLTLLTVDKSYNLIPVLISLPAIYYLFARKLKIAPDLKAILIVFLVWLTPIIVSILLGYSSLSYLDRPVRSLLFVLAGALIIKIRPNKDLFFIGLALGQIIALLLLFQQMMNNVPRPSLWSNPILVSEISVAVFALLIVSWGWQKSKKKWIALLGQACCLPIILLTETRGTLISFTTVLMFVMTISYVYSLFSRRRLLMIFTCALIIVLAILSFTRVGSRFGELVSDITTFQSTAESTSAGTRIELWRESLILVQEKPVTGYGNKAHRERGFELISEGRIRPFVLEYAHFHSDYFEALATRGVPGLLTVLLLYLFFLKLYSKFLKSNPYLALAGMAFVVSYMASSLTDVPLRNGLTSMFFFMGVVVVTAYLNIDSCDEVAGQQVLETSLKQST